MMEAMSKLLSVSEASAMEIRDSWKDEIVKLKSIINSGVIDGESIEHIRSRFHYIDNAIALTIDLLNMLDSKKVGFGFRKNATSCTILKSDDIISLRIALDTMFIAVNDVITDSDNNNKIQITFCVMLGEWGISSETFENPNISGAEFTTAFAEIFIDRYRLPGLGLYE